MNEETKKPLEDSIRRMTEALEEVRRVASSALDRALHDTSDGLKWQRLSTALGDIRHRLGPCAIMRTECWHKAKSHIAGERPMDPAAGTGAFFTPKAAIDAIMANPPLGDLPPGADGVEPRDTPISPDAPQMVRGEDRHMSIPEASGILMELARKRSMSIDQVNALEMAVRRLMCRHFQRQRNWAKRRAAARPSATDLTQRNREAESAEPIGVRSSAPDEKNLSDLGLSAPLRETKTESTEEEAAR